MPGFRRLSVPTARGWCAVCARILHAYSMASCGRRCGQGHCAKYGHSRQIPFDRCDLVADVGGLDRLEPWHRIFAYIFVVGHQYAFCNRVGGTNFAGFYTGCVTGADGKGGQARWEGAQGLNHLKRNAVGFMTGVNHQPLQVRRVNQCFQQLGPDAFLAPTEEPAMHGAAVVREQVEPDGRRCGVPITRRC